MPGTFTQTSKSSGDVTFTLRAKVKDGQVVLWNWFEDRYAVSKAFHGLSVGQASGCCLHPDVLEKCGEILKSNSYKTGTGHPTAAIVVITYPFLHRHTIKNFRNCVGLLIINRCIEPQTNCNLDDIRFWHSVKLGFGN